MSGGFGFNFCGSDIEVNEHEDTQSGAATPVDPAKALLPARVHDLKNILGTMPSCISYTRYEPASLEISEQNILAIRSRCLFDIRAQLMAEADLTGQGDALVGALLTEDIKPSVYEGGFKTWECSVDLAKYLCKKISQRELCIRNAPLRIVELGAGTAVPTCTLLYYLMMELTNENNNTSGPSTPAPIRLLVADYNAHVLLLATMPNLLLSALSSCAPTTLSSSGEIDTTSPAVQSLPDELARRGIQVSAISGAWGQDFVKLANILLSENGKDRWRGFTIILASETIYSPGSLMSFVETVVALLLDDRTGDTDRGEALALIAAKKVYFGVGGSVDDFVQAMEKKGAIVKKVWDSDDKARDRGGKGVGRCILEARMS